MKKLATIIITALMAVVMSIGLAACSGDSGFTLDKSEATVFIGDTLELKCSFSGVAIAGKDVLWKTSNNEVATVNNGVVTGVAAGEATVTAEYYSGTQRSATCKITVTEDTTKMFTLHSELPNEKDELVVISDLIFYNTGKVRVVGTPYQKLFAGYDIELNYTTDGGKLAFTSTVEKITCPIATPELAMIGVVDQVIKNITATVNGNEVKVVGYNEQFQSEQTLGRWTLSDDNATALGVTLGAKEEVRVNSVKLVEKTLEMQAGDVRMVKVEVKPDDATDKTVTFTSSNDKVLKIENNKFVTGWLGSDPITEDTTVTVTATADGKSDTCTVTVKPKPADILVVLADGNENGDWIRISLKAEGNAVVEGVLKTQAYNGTAKYTVDNNGFPVLTDGTITTKADTPATFTLTFTNSDVKDVYGIKFIGITITAKPAEGDEFELGVASADSMTCSALAPKPTLTVPTEYKLKVTGKSADETKTVELYFVDGGKVIVNSGAGSWIFETTYTYSDSTLSITKTTIKVSTFLGVVDTEFVFNITSDDTGITVAVKSNSAFGPGLDEGTVIIETADISKL